MNSRVIILLLITILIGSNNSIAQSTNMRAKAYYIEAEKHYELKKYNESLKSLINVEKVLGSTNSRVLGLKIKVLYKLEEYYKAREALNQFSKYKASSSLQSEILPYVVKVDKRIAEIEEEIRRKKQEQREKELAKIKQQQKINALAEKIKPEIWAAYNKFTSLEEGRPYLVTHRKNLTSSDEEKTILFFYDDEYIAYTIPSVEIAKKLFKDQVRFSMYNFFNVKNDVARIKRGNFKDRRFKKGIHYSNIFLGGNGDELLWTSGKQYHQFDEDLYYYYYYNTLHCDVKLKTGRSDHYYNPYIETGKVEKTVDYRFVRDEALKSKLQRIGVKDKKGSVSNPEGLSIKIVPDGNMKMLFPQKKVTYQLQDKVKADIIRNNTTYKGDVLYFSPLTTKSHYGYIQYNTSYPEKNIFNAISGFSSSFKLDEAIFELFYSSFNKDKGSGKSAYFTNTNFKAFFEYIPKIADGKRVSISYNTSYSERKPEESPVSGKKQKTTDETPVFKLVETMPVFPGGSEALNNYIRTNIKYPENTRKEGIQGEVLVSFVVGKNGQVEEPKVVKSLQSELDKEAVRVVSEMPDWVPGKQRGKSVRVKKTIPVKFTLHSESTSKQPPDEVIIGKQVWMTENLSVSKFRNGEPITHAKTEEEWEKAGEEKNPAWCYLNNDPSNGAKYGKLYNWYAVNDSRGLAPKGWRIPSDDDWTQLNNYLGTNTHSKLKSSMGWGAEDNSTNESGFTALPGGSRYDWGEFDGSGVVYGSWWSVTPLDSDQAWSITLYSDDDMFDRDKYSKNEGFSVRCLKE